MNLYCVYYKLPQEQHKLWVPRVQSFVKEVRERFPPINVSLVQRPEVSAEGLETWMEVYQHPDGLSQAMIETIEALASELKLPAKRATELFIDLRD